MGILAVTFKRTTTNLLALLFLFRSKICNKYATSVDRMFSQNEVSTPFLELPLRNYRRVMKPRLPRKVTAPALINLNRFWNELEEFYNRYDDRRAKNNNNPIITKVATELRLPAYTTDTFDHEPM